MAKSSALYLHARNEFVRKGLLAKGDPLPTSVVGLSLTIIDTFDDFRSRSRNVGGAIDLIHDILIRLPVQAMNRDFDGNAIEGMSRLMSLLPLGSLTGADDEWAYQAPGVDKNKRCPRVQRDADGVAYDTKAPLPDGTTTRKVVTFPYYPERKA